MSTAIVGTATEVTPMREPIADLDWVLRQEVRVFRLSTPLHGETYVVASALETIEDTSSVVLPAVQAPDGTWEMHQGLAVAWALTGFMPEVDGFDIEGVLAQAGYEVAS